MTELKADTKLPDHLGGHLGKTHVDQGVLEYFRDVHKCKSMVDIGCGVGGQSYLAEILGYKPVIGVDGDFTIIRGKDQCINFFTHDYNDGPFKIPYGVDLAWSCEFVEHVKPEYIDNYMQTFKAAKFVAMTFHPPSKRVNKWHFNEQLEPYWIDVFRNYGFIHAPDFQHDARIRSTMRKPFFKNTGLVFVQ